MVAAFTFATSVAAARFLGPELFGKVALFLFLAKILLASNLGSVSGFIFHTYSERTQGASDKRFAAQYSIHLGIAAVIFLCLSPLFGTIYVFGAAGFALLLPFFVAEPVLRVRRNFAASLWPDVVLSGALLGAIAIFFCTTGTSSVQLHLFLATLISLLPLGYLFLRGYKVFPPIS